MTKPPKAVVFFKVNHSQAALAGRAMVTAIGIILFIGYHDSPAKELRPEAHQVVVKRNNRPEDFGFAGISPPAAYERLDKVIKNSPAAKAGLREGDYIVDFRLAGNSGKLFYDFRKTIANNPGQTLLLQVEREPNRKQERQIRLKLGDLRQYPDQKLLTALEEERKLENRAVPLSKSGLEHLPYVPDVIEIFDPKIGQSSQLLVERLYGTKAVSLAQGSQPAQAILDWLGLSDSAQIWLRDWDNKLYPLASSQNLDLPTFNREDPLQEPKYKRDWILCCSSFGPNGGDSFAYLNQILGTWPEQLRNYGKERLPEESLKLTLEKVIVAINDNNLDTCEGHQLLAGEMSYLGNSIKAGSSGVVCLDKIGRLSSTKACIRQLGSKLAVARVGHEGKDFDSYLFFVKTDTWKLTAIRTPASSFETYSHYDLRRFHHYGYGPKSYSKTSHFDNLSAEKKKEYLESEHLSLRSDATLRLWFNQHRKELTDLANLALSEDATLELSDKSIKTRTEALRLADIKAQGTNIAFARLYQTRHSDSGLLYCKTPDKHTGKPLINPYSCIWYEKLDDHWSIVRFSHKAEITTLFDNFACRLRTSQCMVRKPLGDSIIEIKKTRMRRHKKNNGGNVHSLTRQLNQEMAHG